jgi:lactoylglutathione lyase
MADAPNIVAVDHIGVRVRDAARAREFYGKLGFRVTYEDTASPVIILRNAAGVEVNLVVNAGPGAGPNVLMDVPEKHPGFTHVALRVASIEDTVTALGALAIAISEGPVKLGPWNTSVFIRDPDGNVIELTEHRGA